MDHFDLHHEFYVPPWLSGVARTEYCGLVRTGYEVWRAGAYDRAQKLFTQADVVSEAAKGLVNAK